METYEIIKKFRVDNKLTQAQFGEILNCDRYRIADIERGKTAPTIEDIKAISKRFNVSSDYLIGLSDGVKIDDYLKEVSNYIGLNIITVEYLHKTNENIKINQENYEKFENEFIKINSKKELSEHDINTKYEIMDISDFYESKMYIDEGFLEALNKLIPNENFKKAMTFFSEAIGCYPINEDCDTDYQYNKILCEIGLKHDLQERDADDFELALFKLNKYLNLCVDETADIKQSETFERDLSKRLIDDINNNPKERDYILNQNKITIKEFETMCNKYTSNNKKISKPDLEDLKKLHRQVMTCEKFEKLNELYSILKE